MIGLKRGIVDVLPHQSDWHDAFETERASILAHAAELVVDIQHVGSTSVSGLDAKPIVDIAAAVESPEVIPALSEVLTRLRWIDRGDKGQNGGYLFVKESAPEFRTHHLHIVEIDGLQWRNYVTFRNILRQNKHICFKYARLKHVLSKRFSRDRKSYTAAKAKFIASVLSDHETTCKLLRSL